MAAGVKEVRNKMELSSLENAQIKNHEDYQDDSDDDFVSHDSDYESVFYIDEFGNDYFERNGLEPPSNVQDSPGKGLITPSTFNSTSVKLTY